MLSDYLTTLPGAPRRADALPGMAHFAGTGPKGKSCGDCVHRGYYRHEDDRKKRQGCIQFRRFSGRSGPAVRREWPACRHFTEKT